MKGSHHDAKLPSGSSYRDLLLASISEHGKLYISVVVVEARGLVALDKTGFSDPFVTVNVGKRLSKASKAKHKTKPIKKSVCPVWNKHLVVKSKSPTEDHIFVQVWDWNRLSAGKPLGDVSIPVSRLVEKGKVDEWFTLNNIKQGEVHITLVPELEKPKKHKHDKHPKKTLEDEEHAFASQSESDEIVGHEEKSSHRINEEQKQENEHEEATEIEKEKGKDKGSGIEGAKGQGSRIVKKEEDPKPETAKQQIKTEGDGEDGKGKKAEEKKTTTPNKKPVKSISEEVLRWSEEKMQLQKLHSEVDLRPLEPKKEGFSKSVKELPTTTVKHQHNSSSHSQIHPPSPSKEREKESPHRHSSGSAIVAGSSSKGSVRFDNPHQHKTSENTDSFRKASKNRTLNTSGKFSTAFQIYITVIEARDLVAADHSGTSDPYVTVSVDKRIDEPKKALFKTHHKLKTLDPVWKEDFVTESARPDVESIHIQVWDWNRLLKHTPLGEVEIPAKRIIEAEELDDWFPLDNATSGTIHLKLSSAPITSLAEADDTATQTVDLSNVTLRIKIMAAQHLRSVEIDGSTNAYTTVTLGKLAGRPDKALFKTHVVKDSHHPVWEQEFEIANIDIKKMEQPNIYLQVWHCFTIMSDTEIGHVVVPILKIVKKKEVEDKWFSLQGVKKGQLRVVTSYTLSDATKPEATGDSQIVHMSSTETEPEVPKADLTWVEKVEDHYITRKVLPYGHLIVAVLICYLMGYYGVPKIWLLLAGLAIWQIDRRWKKEEFKRRYAKMQVMRKNMIVKHETESAEWLNVFLKKIWPHFTTYLANLLREKLGSSLKELLEETKPPVVEAINISSIVFKDSEIPLEILSVKAANYPYVQLDLAVEYHSAIRVVAVIVASAKLTTINVPICIKDLYLKGVLRMNFYVSAEFPFLSQIELAFKTKPSLGIRIQPLYTVNLLDVPVLHDWILKTISTAIKQSMVLPQRLTIDIGLLATGQHLTIAQEVVVTTKKALGQKKQKKERKLAELLDMNSVLQSLHKGMSLPPTGDAPAFGERIATLKLVNIKGRDLKVADKNGKSDPYVILRAGGRVKKTDPLRKTLNPDWVFTSEFPVYDNMPHIMDLLVMDWNRTKKHIFLGVGVLDFSNLIDEDQSQTYTVKLHGVTTGKLVVELVFYKEEDETKHHHCLPHTAEEGVASLMRASNFPPNPKQSQKGIPNTTTTTSTTSTHSMSLNRTSAKISNSEHHDHHHHHHHNT